MRETLTDTNALLCLAAMSVLCRRYDPSRGTAVLVCSPLRPRASRGGKLSSDASLGLASLVPGYTCKKRSLELQYDADDATAGDGDVWMRAVSSLHVKESGHAPLTDDGASASSADTKEGEGMRRERSRARAAPRRISAIRREAEEARRPLSPHTSQNPLEFK